MKLYFKPKRVLTAGVFCLVLLLAGCTYNNEEELYGAEDAICNTDQVTYLAHIKPILQQNCYSCHSSSFPSGSVVLDTFEGVRTQANRNLLAVINHEPGHPPMPKGGNKLPACDLAKIKKWIEGGTLNN